VTRLLVVLLLIAGCETSRSASSGTFTVRLEKLAFAEHNGGWVLKYFTYADGMAWQEEPHHTVKCDTSLGRLVDVSRGYDHSAFSLDPLPEKPARCEIGLGPGAWNEPAPPSVWFCYDGKRLSLGHCPPATDDRTAFLRIGGVFRAGDSTSVYVRARVPAGTPVTVRLACRDGEQLRFVEDVKPAGSLSPHEIGRVGFWLKAMPPGSCQIAAFAEGLETVACHDGKLLREGPCGDHAGLVREGTERAGQAVVKLAAQRGRVGDGHFLRVELSALTEGTPTFTLDARCGDALERTSVTVPAGQRTIVQTPFVNALRPAAEPCGLVVWEGQTAVALACLLGETLREGPCPSP
jgi:hypothetical protein